ncbi:ribosome assembly cofactor RimP [Tenacibaculum finnmarkense]|uniref:ribosome assembly cofactor RimP n=1 Tax=Tenacibaculum finnmarkense TaxID=2781243 RepID=UPI001E4E1A3D|nr:ribosome assembly cofactor RimP [Tenacibaculum finnmarkense]MCD8413048.1 ribosome assembly cofactor RimP [Tenacibaculum finnmarkense genomovar ulcerans]MCG8206296.1 ribosome assembly cofactor RimP [Tenacibaculum finnmarkense genomovar finnmarkense]MCG8722341.1 ribosome assembly cofactor RimP [Tenacibaculum finnmarkense]MCG8740746.1 ribosome assembly cofactor RimP [Tenacibaculum finnmarkense]MCG8764010.1 ribosome assembly cofactor RimP [Tenacibaculum finnmarkense]
MNQEKVKELLDEALLENESLYLIDLQFLANSKIKVIVDGDSGVPLNECMRISRKIEHNLDREEDDFSLEVTTPDIAHALTVKRQYKKNINRILKVKTATEEFEGTLTQATDKDITLFWKAREPKPIGKGKHTVEKAKVLLYQDISEAKVKIIF